MYPDGVQKAKQNAQGGLNEICFTFRVELDALAAGPVADVVASADTPPRRRPPAARARPPGRGRAELRLLPSRLGRGVAALEGRLEQLLHLAAVVPAGRRRREGAVAGHDASLGCSRPWRAREGRCGLVQSYRRGMGSRGWFHARTTLTSLRRGAIGRRGQQLAIFVCREEKAPVQKPKPEPGHARGNSKGAKLCSPPRGRGNSHWFRRVFLFDS